MRTLPLEPRAIVVQLYHLYTHFPHNARLISSANRDFLILRLINTLAYLFTVNYIVADNINGSFINNMHVLLIVL